MTLSFVVGEKYSRKDIYNILDVPKERQGGIWNTGYTKYNNDIFIFTHINSAGTTGHNYNNKFIGDDLEWYGKTNHSLNAPTIQLMLDPPGNIHIFIREDNTNVKFTYQGTSYVKEYEDTKPVRILWGFSNVKRYNEDRLAEEISDSNQYIEGATKTITVNAYERNEAARDKCIEYYGCKCMVCEFDFEEVYGEVGLNFIHVHHLKELSSISEEYEVDPINDLRPVCPNCHAMIHKREPAYAINEIRDMIRLRG